MQQLLASAEYCPTQLNEFWSCLNESLPVARDVEVWPGRPCCDLALSAQCRRKCQHAKSKIEVRRSCTMASEKSLFACLRKQDEGETCCEKSPSLSCSMVCRSLYLTSVPRGSRPPMGVVEEHCGGAAGEVTQCINSQAPPPRTSNPADNLPCCDKAKTQSCQETCRRVLQSTMSEDQIIEELIVACGGPDVREPLWQCFLQTQTPPNGSHDTSPAVSRLDNARLQCCSKAVTSRCRELCTKTFKMGWSFHSEFYQSCSYIQPVSTIEATMHKCLLDVDEACQLGCSGLSYCTNFNNRPTELFRICSHDGDRAAETAFRLWENGMIRLPQMAIPVKDVRTCEPEKWKAIACALQIKPCVGQPAPLSLCKEDCMDILTQCVDRERLGTEQSVPQLCNALPSMHSAGECVSFSTYLRPSPYSSLEGEVSNPCKPNPCHADEVCEIRRRKCKHAANCKQFICKSACSMGQVSSMRVPTGTHVRIPDTSRSSPDQDCFLGCRCDSKGELEHCTALPCLQRKLCMLGQGNKQEHGSHFMLDNSQCICYDGNLLCSRQLCLTDTPSQLSGTTCPTQYKPVCGANGKTYPNSCLAQCTGVTNFISATSCSDFDPCKIGPCGAGERCVARHQVCLGEQSQQNCPQYECVSDAGICNHHNHGAVCDTSGEEFSNACLLLSHQRTLAYRGHCQSSCSESGMVCGHDGETYSSECAAWAARTLVDYTGPCRATGNLTGSSQQMRCAGVECPVLRPSYCKGVIPPGSCCPVCAAQMRTLFDSRLVDIAADRMNQGPVTVQQVVGALSRLLMVAQCDVFGFLSLEGDLVLLVSALAQQPSDVQVEACNSEAERLATHIGNGIPTLTLYLELSSLLLAPTQGARLHYRDPMYNVSAGASATALSGTLLTCAALLVIFTQTHRLHAWPRHRICS